MPQKPRLTVSIPKAEKTISHYLNTGDDFYSAPRREPELSETIKRFDKWCNDVKEELTELFTTSEIAERFANIKFDRGHIQDIDEESKRYLDFSGLLLERMDWLKRLKQNLSTYEVIVDSKATDFWSLIHPEITDVTKNRFDAGLYADSIETALKHINATVKAKVKMKTGAELDGSSLMKTAFSLKNPIIALDNLSTESGRNVQLGYMEIFSGAMTGIRNPKAHEIINIDEKRAIHLIFLVSLLMYKLDEVV